MTATLAPDPGLYAPLTCRELDVLGAYLNSGWRMLAATGQDGGEQEVPALLADIGQATETLLTAIYDPWRVWRAASGRFWAARSAGGALGCGETVDADTGAAMGELLAARSAS